jgi:hypothetical protein
MPEISKTHMGGTMRLGLRPTVFEAKTEDSKLRRLYGNKEVAWERHRHRYEVEPKYVDELESKGGLRFVGKDERGERMQMLELDGESTIPIRNDSQFSWLRVAGCGLRVESWNLSCSRLPTVPARRTAPLSGTRPFRRVSGVRL